jgi:hypothetical protein
MHVSVFFSFVQTGATWEFSVGYLEVGRRRLESVEIGLRG